jgi:hypothetical protein
MYEFTSKNRGSDRIVFLLTLDKKKKTERIIIGESVMVKLRIEKNIGEVLYDETRPLGQLLLNFESDPDKEWQLNASYLADNFAGLFPTKNVKSKALKPYTDFLRGKYASGEPSAMFAAVKTWEEYWRCFGIANGSDVFLGRANKLYKPFSVFAEPNCVWKGKATNALSTALFSEESQVELYYPIFAEKNDKRRLSGYGERGECAVAQLSFIPMIFYYLQRIEEWRYIFQRCKICGGHFLTTSKRYELCSEKCRKVTAVQAKKQYTERNKGDKVEAIYKNYYNYWYNRKRKLTAHNATDEEIAVFNKAFSKFKKAAVQRKTKAKNGKKEYAEFTSWLVKQQDIIDELVPRGRL